MEGEGVPQESRGLSALLGLWLCWTPQEGLNRKEGDLMGSCVCSSVYCIVCAKIYASFPTCQQHRDNKFLLLVPSTLNTLFTMVQLKPDIYTMIVETMLAADWPADHDTKLAQQQCLARMMQASKVGGFLRPPHSDARRLDW